MRHSLLFRTGQLWMIAALLGGLDSGVRAAEGVRIRGSTVAVNSDGGISFEFDAGAGERDGFQLQATVELGETFEWVAAPNAVITEVIQGLYRVEIPLTGKRPSSYYRVAASPFEPAPLFINEVMSANASKIADAAGQYWDWIEIYNPNDTVVDLRAYGLSDDGSRPHRWQFPEISIQPSAFALVFASGLDSGPPDGELHASFKLNADGERLFLAAPDGRIVDQVQLPALGTDQSAGRLPDGGEIWHVYSKTQSTPGAANLVVSLGPPIFPPRLSIAEPFLPKGAVLPLELAADSPARTIRYTTNGAPVSATSLIYSEPIVLSRTTVVRAVAFDGERSSAETVRTFFFGAEHDLPIISLATPQAHFDFRDGFLYGMTGSVLSSSGRVLQNFPFSGSNAWKDREVEVSIEFYEPDGRLAFQHRAGLKIFGGWGSRGYPQKSLALFARQRYGEGKFKHQIFQDKPIDGFESLVLRNSGNDNQSTHQTAPRPPITAFGPALPYGSYFVNGSFTLMRDAMMQRLIADIDLDRQAYRPAVVYLNGEYWGIYNLREKINEDYVVTNHGIEKGKIDLIEGYGGANAGNNSVYNVMRNFIATRDLRDPIHYAMVEERYLEIDNFIDYHLAVIYFQNFDIGNIKCWRPRTPTGRFRWVIYDQDYGFNLWPPEVYLPAMKRDYGDYDNMFRFYTSGSGTDTGWPNAGGRTLLLRRLLTNDGFKERFIRRCADLLNGHFREERVVDTIQRMAAVIRPEIPRHLERWSWTELQPRGFDLPHQPEYEPFTQETWEKNLEVLVDFAQSRPAKLRQDCIDHFQLTAGLAEVTVNLIPAEAGRVRFNSLALAAFPWTGVCFREYPVTVTAIPGVGFRFAGWSNGEMENDQPGWEMNLASSTTGLTARFEPVSPETQPASAVIVTEFQYHPAADQDSGDWIELHNRGQQPVHLAGWILRDDNDDHEFLLPEITLAPGAYTVLCQDQVRFSRAYPDVTGASGDFGFGLGNGGDAIRLYDPFGNPLLSIAYNDELPWPPDADGTGHTVTLVDPNSFSASPEAWSGSRDAGGSPGNGNP